MVGTALMVERWYDGSQFALRLVENEACNDNGVSRIFLVTETTKRALAGSRISGGSIMKSSAGLRGSPTRLVVLVWKAGFCCCWPEMPI